MMPNKTPISQLLNLLSNDIVKYSLSTTFIVYQQLTTSNFC